MKTYIAQLKYPGTEVTKHKHSKAIIECENINEGISLAGKLAKKEIGYSKVLVIPPHWDIDTNDVNDLLRFSRSVSDDCFDADFIQYVDAKTPPFAKLHLDYKKYTRSYTVWTLNECANLKRHMHGPVAVKLQTALNFDHEKLEGIKDVCKNSEDFIIAYEDCKQFKQKYSFNTVEIVERSKVLTKEPVNPMNKVYTAMAAKFKAVAEDALDKRKDVNVTEVNSELLNFDYTTMRVSAKTMADFILTKVPQE